MDDKQTQLKREKQKYKIETMWARKEMRSKRKRNIGGEKRWEKEEKKPSAKNKCDKSVKYIRKRWSTKYMRR